MDTNIKDYNEASWIGLISVQIISIIIIFIISLVYFKKQDNTEDNSNSMKKRKRIIFFYILFTFSSGAELYSTIILKPRFSDTQYIYYKKYVNNTFQENYLINEKYFIYDRQKYSLNNTKEYSFYFSNLLNETKDLKLESNFDLSKCHNFSDSELGKVNFFYRILGVVYFLNIFCDVIFCPLKYLFEFLLMKINNDEKSQIDENMPKCYSFIINLIQKTLLKMWFISISLGNGGFNLFQPVNDCLIPMSLFNLIASLYFTFCLIIFSIFLFICCAGCCKEGIKFVFSLIAIVLFLFGFTYFICIIISWFLGNGDQVIAASLHLSSFVSAFIEKMLGCF